MADKHQFGDAKGLRIQLSCRCFLFLFLKQEKAFSSNGSVGFPLNLRTVWEEKNQRTFEGERCAI